MLQKILAYVQKPIRPRQCAYIEGFFRVCSTLISQDMIGNMLGVVRGKGKRDSDGQRNFMFTPLAHDYRKDMKKTEGCKHYTHTVENAWQG